MENNISRRHWLKNAGLLSTGFGSLLIGGNAFANEQNPLSAFDRSNDFKEQFVRLFYNENPYGPPEGALAKVMEVANRGNRYSTFSTYDFEALRAKIAAEEGLTKDHVLLGHGSFQPIIWIAEHFIQKEGEIIVPSPTFDIVGMYARKLGAKTRAIEVNEKMEMNLVAMEKAINNQTSLVCVCHPNNPTGTLVDPVQLNDFCETVTKKCPVFVDEAYIQYTDAVPNWRNASMVSQIKAGNDVIVSRTFSKVYGMAGFRIGYLLAKPELIKSLNDRFTLGFPGNMPNTLSVAAAIGALEDNAFLEQSKQKNRAAKTNFYKQLQDLNLPHVPTQANFIYFKVPDFPKFKKLMNDNKVLLAGGWPSKPNWARVTLGKNEELDVFYELLNKEDWR
ncbi:MAG: histidinol-phosphate transaminase [Bacteroidota bacterium]